MAGYIHVDHKSVYEDLTNTVIEIMYDDSNNQPHTARLTLIRSLIPENTNPQQVQAFHESQTRVLNPESNPKQEVITAYDIDSHGWRSFRVDRVRSAQM